MPSGTPRRVQLHVVPPCVNQRQRFLTVNLRILHRLLPRLERRCVRMFVKSQRWHGHKAATLSLSSLQRQHRQCRVKGTYMRKSRPDTAITVA